MAPNTPPLYDEARILRWRHRSVTETPSHLLRRCHQIAVALFLDECGMHDLTPLQFGVLDILARSGPQDQATLGGAAALDRTTVAVVLRNLEERSLIQRRASERDRRAKIVTLTESGAELAEAAQDSAETAQERMIAPLDEHEREEFLRMLRKLADGNNGFSRAPQRTR